MEICKRKQELDQESDQEKKNKNSTKIAIKKTRKLELDQEKKKKLSLFLDHFLARFLVFLLSCFLYKFPPLLFLAVNLTMFYLEAWSQVMLLKKAQSAKLKFAITQYKSTRVFSLKFWVKQINYKNMYICMFKIIRQNVQPPYWEWLFTNPKLVSICSKPACIFWESAATSPWSWACWWSCRLAKLLIWDRLAVKVSARTVKISKNITILLKHYI